MEKYYRSTNSLTLSNALCNSVRYVISLPVIFSGKLVLQHTLVSRELLVTQTVSFPVLYLDVFICTTIGR